jgi:threonine dehydrogenase-like Zn-dependent dehydrogenase
MGDAMITAMVQTGPRAMELRELPRPTIGTDEALVRVEACGSCGTDIGMYDDDRGTWEYPTVDVEQQDLAAALATHATRGIDVVVDTTPGSPDAVVDAIRLVRPGGTVVAAGIKRRPTPEFPVDELIKREVSLKGVLGTGSEHYRQAIALIAGSARPLHRMVTHVLPLERLEHGIGLLAGDVPDEAPLAVVIAPT